MRAPRADRAKVAGLPGGRDAHRIWHQGAEVGLPEDEIREGGANEPRDYGLGHSEPTVSPPSLVNLNDSVLYRDLPGSTIGRGSRSGFASLRPASISTRSPLAEAAS